MLESENFVDVVNYIKKCESNCTGYVTEKGQCELCKTMYCTKCYERKILNHNCNKTLQETIQYIKNNENIKPCPKCLIPISQDGGCSSMWCTNCKIPFDWRTNKPEIVSDRIDNPHYFDFIHENKDGPIIAGGIDTIEDLSVHLHFAYINSPKYGNNYDYYPRTVFSNALNVIDEYYFRSVITEYSFSSCFEERIAYIRKKMTEKEFKDFLYTKDINKYEEMGIIYSIFFKEIFNALKQVVHDKSLYTIKKTIEKLDTERLKFNKYLAEWCIYYHENIYMYISPDYNAHNLWNSDNNNNPWKNYYTGKREISSDEFFTALYGFEGKLILNDEN